MTGCRYATAALARAPLRWVTWYQPTPSWRAPLKSSFESWPHARAASMNACDISLRARPSDTGSGPPLPCHSSAPRSLSSARLK